MTLTRLTEQMATSEQLNENMIAMVELRERLLQVQSLIVRISGTRGVL